MIKKFIQIVPFYPLPVQQTFKQDYFTWPAVMMRGKGFKCEFVTLRGKQKSFEVVNGFPVKRFASTLQLLFYVLRQDALVHAHLRPYPPSLFSGLLPKKKVLTTYTYEFSPSFLIKQLSLFLMKRFDKVIPHSPYEESLYLNYGFKKEKVNWLPLAIDYGMYSRRKKDATLAKKFGLHKNGFVIITVANFRYFKRVDILLKAFKEFKKSVKNSKLIIVGQDWLAKEGKPTIKEMINQLKLKDVLWTDYKPPEVIRKLFSYADVFVNTSFVEAQGIAVDEAAASKLPLCLSNLGSFKSVFKEHALYHRYDDYRQLSKNLYRYYADRKLAKRNASYVQKVIKNWDYSIVKKKLWRTYKEVLSH